MAMKEDSDSAGMVGTVGPPVTGTMNVVFDVDRMAIDQDRLIADGLAAQDTLARLRITLIKFEENPANLVAYGVLLREVWRVIGRN